MKIGLLTSLLLKLSPYGKGDCYDTLYIKGVLFTVLSFTLAASLCMMGSKFTTTGCLSPCSIRLVVLAHWHLCSEMAVRYFVSFRNCPGSVYIYTCIAAMLRGTRCSIL